MNITPITPSFKGNLRFSHDVHKTDLGGNAYTVKNTFELNPNKITSFQEIDEGKNGKFTIIRDDNNTPYKFSLPLYSVKMYISDAQNAKENDVVCIPNSESLV